MTIRRMLRRQQPDSRCNGVQRFVPNSKCNSLLRRPGHRLTIAARVYAHSPRQARQLSSWDYALNMPSIKNLGSLTCLTGSSPPGREPIKWSRYMSHRRAFIPRLGRKFCPVRLDLSKRKPAPAQTFSYRRRRRAPTLQGGQSQRPTQAPSLMTLPPNSARQKSTDIDTRAASPCRYHRSAPGVRRSPRRSARAIRALSKTVPPENKNPRSGPTVSSRSRPPGKSETLRSWRALLSLRLMSHRRTLTPCPIPPG